MGTARTLIGVGVGPGDPELVTRKAVAVFVRADVILVPSTEASGDDPGRAEQIVLAACPDAAGKLRRVPFSMAQRRGVGSKRRQSWRASAQAAVDAFQAGAATVAFATVGDPSVYSTFSYLAAEVQAVVPDVDVSVVPGITAMQALAAASLTPLVEGRESLTLVPATAGLDAVGAALDHSDTVVAYKGGRQLSDMLALIQGHGRDGVLGVNVGLPGQTITPLSEVTAESAPYFSTVLVAPRRTSTGGAL
ncbi:MAG: precorrin-2 C(20)-methyltransferase [Actinomycetales bacterium]|nr:precorrin-2 C(20)-methyltransferase [Actinomycetales bacterium]